jgi:hypothetical protein
MQSMMQVLRDTQSEGRFFPRDGRIQVIEAGDSSLVLPDPDAHTTFNHLVGLMDEQERWGLDADDVRSSIARSAPDCEILELDEASS